MEGFPAGRPFFIVCELRPRAGLFGMSRPGREGGPVSGCLPEEGPPGREQRHAPQRAPFRRPPPVLLAAGAAMGYTCKAPWLLSWQLS